MPLFLKQLKTVGRQKRKYNRIIVFSQEDEQGLVEVAENARSYSLHFGTSGKQSEIYKILPYAPCLEYIEAMLAGVLFKQNLKSAFFMGLGGGSLPKIIDYHFPDSLILIAETRPLVYEVARKYFSFPVKQNIEIVFEEGCEALGKQQVPYDMIFIDAYSKDGLAKSLDDVHLGELLAPWLKRGAVAVVNLWQKNEKQLKDLQAIGDLVDEGICLNRYMRLSGNIICFLMQNDVFAKSNATLREFIARRKAEFFFDLQEQAEYISSDNKIRLNL